MSDNNSESTVPLATLCDPTTTPGLEQLLTKPDPATLSLVPAQPASPPAVVETSAAPVSTSRRRGRVARLPKHLRDMVNRMIWNGVPYKNIIAALHEADAGFDITERNLSNWATGGYLEWRALQDFVLDNRLDQDHLVDHLRTENATQLPEVGLQAAATRLSQIFLQKIARADDVESNLASFSEMVDLLCRLNREINVLQKQRDDSRRTLGPAHDAARTQNEEEETVLEQEHYFSYPDDPESGLENPPEKPCLAPEPTYKRLEHNDLHEELQERREALERTRIFMDALSGKKPTLPAELQDPPSPQPKSANGTSPEGSGSLR